MRQILIISFLLVNLNLQAVLPDPVKQFNYSVLNDQLDDLQATCPPHVKLAADFELPALVALNYYPELENTRIRFQQKNIKTTMQSVPRADFLFRKKANRVYKISIDNEVRNKKGLLLKDVPFNAQIGVIGHELAHVVDYNSKTKMGIVFFGIGYLFHKNRRQAENRVDEITIEHGLGYQVKDFSDFVLNNAELNERYLKYKRKFYYSPNQLMQVMLKYPIY